MAVTEVGTPAAPTVSSGTNSPSVSPSWSGTQTLTAGNYLVAVVTNWGGTTGGTPGTPAGWTQALTIKGSSRSSVTFFTKVAAGSDTAPTISASNTGTATFSTLAAQLHELTGQDATTPLPTSGTATGTTVNPLVVTTSGNVPQTGCFALGAASLAVSASATSTLTAGSGWTSIADNGSTTTRAHWILTSQSNPTSGATLSESFGYTTTGAFLAGAIIVVQPSSGVAGTATLSGSGTLAGSAIGPGSAAMSGSGTLAATAALSGGITGAAFGTGTNNTATTVSAPAPAGVGLTDLLLMWVTDVTSTVTFSVTAGSTGWTSVGPTTGNNITATLFYKNADSTDVTLSGSSGSYTITPSSAHSAEGIIVCAPGCSFDPSSPPNAGQFAANATGSTYPATGVTTSNSGDTLMLFGAVRVPSSTPPVMSLPGGFTSFVAQGNTSSAAAANIGVFAGTQIQVSAGATGTETVSSAATGNGGAFLVALSGSGVTPSATVVQQVAGAPDSGGFQAITKLSGATSVRLAYSTSPSMTSPSFVAAQTPDSLGYVRHTVSGLSAATVYYYQAADTPSGGGESLIGAIGQCKTLPASGAPADFTVALVSCIAQQDTTTPPALDAAMADWISYGADLNIFTGDFDYSGTVSTTLATQVGIFETQIARYSALGDMTAQHWGYYCRSDHEAGPDNGDSNNTYTATNIAAAQQVFPFGVLGDTVNTPVHGLYQAWTAGRVRFIMIDVRNTDRSPGGNTDNGSKTMLGATQLAWLENQLIQSEPLKVIISDVGWMGTPTIVSGPDKWWSYDTERQAIISYIAANKAAVQNVMLWHGDTHLVGCTPGSANSWGGFSVYCAAPLLNIGGGLMQSTFTQKYNNGGSGECRQYGRISFTDTGSKITVDFQGWDAVNAVAQVEQIDVFETPVTLSGSGTLAASPVRPAAAALSGTGTLAAAETIGWKAALSGSGTLAAAEIQSGAATLSGSGTLTGSPVRPATAALSGSGTLSASPVLPGAAALTGAGTLSASPLRAGAAALTGTGTLAATGVKGFPGTAALSGTGTLSASVTTGTTATLSGSGTLNASSGGAATLTGSGTLSASPVLTGAAALTGTGTLSATGVKGFISTAALSGSGTLAATEVQSGVAALSGSGTLAASPVRPATAALSGTGTLAASPVFTGLAALSGTGTLASAGETIRTIAALSGSGTLAATYAAGGAALSGSGTLSATAVLTISGTAALTGSGTLAATATQGAQAAMSGSGTLSATDIKGFQGAAALSGTGTLAATEVQSGAASLSGSGTLSATAAQGIPAALSGTGTLSAASSTPGTATLSGTGILSASPVRAGAATLSGSGTLAALWKMGQQAALSGLGTLLASPSFPRVSVMSGTGTLSAIQSAAVVPATGTGSVFPFATGTPAVTSTINGTGTVTPKTTSTTGVTHG